MSENKPENARKDKGVARGQPFLTVAAFGKHPSEGDFKHWGGQPQFLKQAKQEFFVDTIKPLIESERWDASVDGPGSSPRQWHWLWQKDDEFLFGLMWPSKDESGRLFPMTLCAHCQNCDVLWAMETIFPALAGAAEKLRQLASRAEVEQCIQDAERKCEELAPSSPVGSGRWLEQASNLVKDSQSREASEALARALYFIHSRLERLAVSEKEIGRRKTEEFESMRLPCPGENYGRAMAGWLALLRTQIHNEAPVLLIHSGGAGYCDVICGGIIPTSEVSKANALCLQQGVDRIPLTTDKKYPLDAEFEALFKRAMESIPLDWGDRAKATIFGPVPRSYKPCFPERGDQPVRKAPESATAAASVNVKKPLLPPLNPKVIKQLAMVAAALAVMGLIVVLASSLFHSSPDKVKPPLLQQDQAKLFSAFTNYVHDYDGWFSALLDKQNPARMHSHFLDSNLIQIGSSARLTSFEPLEIYGSSARLDRTEPDLNKLAEKSENFERAFRARDKVRTFINEAFPAKIQSDIEKFAGSPLAAAAQSCAPTAGINTAAASLTEKATSLSTSEAALAALAASWKQLQSEESELAAFDMNNLPRLTKEKESTLAADTNAVLALRHLGVLAAEDSQTLSWLNATRPSLDEASLRNELAHTNVTSFAAWTNRAAEFARIYIDSDPRADLRSKYEQMETNQLRDVREAAKDRSSHDAVEGLAGLEGLTKQAGAELDDLQKTPAILRNKPALDKKIAKTGEDLAVLARNVQAVWDKIYSLPELVKQQEAVVFKNSTVNGLWTKYIQRVKKKVEGTRSPPPRTELITWREKFEATHAFLDQAGQIKVEDIAPGLADTPKLAHAILADYCARLMDENTSDALALKSSFDNLGSDPNKVKLDADARIFSANLARTLGELAAVRGGGVPTNLDEFRKRYQAMDQTGFLRIESPEISTIKELNTSIWSLSGSVASFGENLPNSPPRDFLRMAMSLARLNEATGWPQGVAGWKAAFADFQLAQRVTQNAPPELKKETAAQAIHSWLDSQWAKASAGIQTFDEIEQCAALGTASDLPANLAYNSRVSRLIRSYSNDVPAFQRAASELLNSGCAAPHRDILAKVIKLPPDGTGWDDLEPRKHGIEIVRGSDGRVWLARQGFTNEVRLMGNVFISLSMFSCDQFCQLAKSDQDLMRAWTSDVYPMLRDAEAKDDFSVFNLTASYLLNLSPEIDGSQMRGISVHASRAGNQALSPTLQRFAAVSGSQPVNLVKPDLALTAAKAWGCRLLKPQEWPSMFPTLPGSAEASLESARIAAVYDELSKKFSSTKALKPFFFFTPGASSPLGADAGSTLFSHPSELLADGDKFYVTQGASSVPVSKDQAGHGFADVGFRLVFDWVGTTPENQVRDLLSQLRPSPPTIAP